MPDCEAVTLWRTKFKLNLSASWKHDVEITVTDIPLWREILDNWFYVEHGKKRTKHPGIKGLLDEYQSQLEKRNADNEAAALSARSRERLSERGRGLLSKVPSETERLYFRVG